MKSLSSEIYEEAKAEILKPVEEIRNLVKEIYKPFCTDMISRKDLITAEIRRYQGRSEIVFQSIEGLHEACPGHTGDWYFTGNYPTPGGNKVANQSFINYMRAEMKGLTDFSCENQVIRKSFLYEARCLLIFSI